MNLYSDVYIPNLNSKMQKKSRDFGDDFQSTLNFAMDKNTSADEVDGLFKSTEQHLGHVKQGLIFYQWSDFVDTRRL